MAYLNWKIYWFHIFFIILGLGYQTIGYIGNTVHPQAALSNAFTYRGTETQMYQQSDYVTGIARHDQGGNGSGMLLIYF